MQVFGKKMPESRTGVPGIVNHEDGSRARLGAQNCQLLFG